MIIKNVLKYTEDYQFELSSISIKEDKFIDNSYDDLLDDDTIDGEGCYAIPGLVDIHIHGCKGADFCDGTLNAIETICAYEALVGVTTICPATMTLSKESLLHIASIAKQYYELQANETISNKRAFFAGINMEGPFISPEKKGAQSALHICQCDIDFFDQMQDASNNLIKMVDIAPEQENALSFIDALSDKVRISIAHTTADYITTKSAFEHGAKHVTHLYNAMPPLSHREPGVIGAAIDDPECFVEVICDGIHIHPSMIRATFSMFGAERIVLVSDSMRATGMPDGTYTLGGQDVIVEGNTAKLVCDGSLAGSVTNLMDCLRIAVKQMNIPLESAVRCATMNPAKAIGIDMNYGSITPGKYANLILLDQNLAIKKIFVNGHLLEPNI